MSDENDPFRPLSEEEKEFVQADLKENAVSAERPADAPPDAPVNASHTQGLDIPLPPGAERIVQQDLNEELGHEPSGTDDESQRG